MRNIVWAVIAFVLFTVAAKAGTISLICTPEGKNFSFTFVLDTDRHVVVSAKDGYNNQFQANLSYQSTDTTIMWNEFGGETNWVIDRSNLKLEEVEKNGRWVRRSMNCRREQPL
jgi:hypothetical protein